MAKHIWEIVFSNQNKSKKIIYRCSACHAEYIKKQNDEFNEDSQCSKCVNDKLYILKTKFNTSKFTGVYVNFNSINYMSDGKTHRTDGYAVIFLNGLTDNAFVINGKYMPDVNSIEEAVIKELLE